MDLKSNRSVLFTFDIKADDHVCHTRCLEEHYAQSDSPNQHLRRSAELLDAESELSSDRSKDYNTKLTAEDIRADSIVDANYYESGVKPQWAHVKARSDCRNETEKLDAANRLVMDQALHAMYDGTAVGNSPLLSIWCPGEEDDAPAESPNKRKRVELAVKFAHDKSAQVHGPRLNGEVKKDRTYRVFVHKENPEKFRKLINQRHEKNIKAGFLLGVQSDEESWVAKEIEEPS